MLLMAPCYKSNAQGSTPGAVFSSEMISEATIERTVELLKMTNSGNGFSFLIFEPSLSYMLELNLYFNKHPFVGLSDCLLI